MSSGSGIAFPPILRRLMAGSPEGRTTPGFEDSQRIEGALDEAEERHDARAVDPAQQARAEPPIAMLAGRGSAQADDERR